MAFAVPSVAALPVALSGRGAPPTGLRVAVLYLASRASPVRDAVQSLAALPDAMCGGGAVLYWASRASPVRDAVQSLAALPTPCAEEGQPLRGSA